MATVTTTYLCPFERDTEDEAKKDLQDYRNTYSKNCGWIEIRGLVEKLPNGKFRSVWEGIQV